MDEPDGTEVTADLADMVQILTRKNAELEHRNTILEAAVMKLRREAEGAQPAGEPGSNGEAGEVVLHGPQS